MVHSYLSEIFYVVMRQTGLFIRVFLFYSSKTGFFYLKQVQLVRSLHLEKADGTEWKDVAQGTMPIHVSQLISDHRPWC